MKHSILERLLHLDKRLGQIKFGLESFVRTNNPKELFRAAGFLLSKYTGDSSPLHDAIENGHIDNALIIIEQIMYFPGEKNLLEKVNAHGQTPLLLAARYNQWKVVQMILEHRVDLAKQKDHHDNNFLHLLVRNHHERIDQTMGKISEMLSEELKIDLFEDENEHHETFVDIAKFQNKTALLKLFHVTSDDWK